MRAIAAVLAACILATATASAETIHFSIRVDLDAFAFLDPVDGFSHAGEPFVLGVSGSGLDDSDCGGVQNVVSGDCNDALEFDLSTLGPGFNLEFYDLDPGLQDVDIHRGAGAPGVHISIEVGGWSWDSDEDLFLGCHDVDFADWCTLGGDSNQHDPPEGSLRIRIVRTG